MSSVRSSPEHILKNVTVKSARPDLAIRRSDLLSAYPPLLALGIQLICDLLRDSHCDVGFVRAEAQQGKSTCQRACQVFRSDSACASSARQPTKCCGKRCGDRPSNVPCEPETFKLVKHCSRLINEINHTCDSLETTNINKSRTSAR